MKRVIDRRKKPSHTAVSKNTPHTTSSREQLQQPNPQPSPKLTPQTVQALQRTVGNQATMRLLPNKRAKTAPAISPYPATGIQRQWLVHSNEKEYFWQGGTNEAEGEPPFYLQGMKKIDPPDKYNIDGQSRSRQLTLVYSLSHYVKLKNINTNPVVADNFNPQGRFATSSVSTFVPNPHLEADQQKAVLQQLKEKDKTFSTTTDYSQTRTPEGYPTHVQVETGETLQFVSANDFGAVYAQNPSPNTRATHTSKAGDELTPSDSDTKIGQNFAMNSDLLKAFSGKERSKTQKAVMGGISAADAAEKGGFVRDEGKGWEWLHMIAHSMGGLETVGPQVQENLVAGTHECNTQMIVVEELIKSLVLKNKGKAKLWVGVSMLDAKNHIGHTINYDFELYNEAGQPVAMYHWSFDALSRRQPLSFENRTARYTSREQHLPGAPVSQYIPRSLPTAHQPYTSSDKDPLNQLTDTVLNRLQTLDPEAFVQNLVELRNNKQLSKELLIDIGEEIAPDNIIQYFQLIHQQIGPKAGEWLLYSFLPEQNESSLLQTGKELLKFYGRVEGFPAWMQTFFAGKKIDLAQD